VAAAERARPPSLDDLAHELHQRLAIAGAIAQAEGRDGSVAAAAPAVSGAGVAARAPAASTIAVHSADEAGPKNNGNNKNTMDHGPLRRIGGPLPSNLATAATRLRPEGQSSTLLSAAAAGPHQHRRMHLLASTAAVGAMTAPAVSAG